MDAQVHRFRAKVALYVGTGETVYLTPNAAIEFASVIRRTALEIKKISDFSKSTVGTYRLTFDGRKE